MKCLLVCTAFYSPPRYPHKPSPPKAPPASPAATESATIAGKAITISYSSPGGQGTRRPALRQGWPISHDPTYPVWRAGANAATKLHTDADLLDRYVQVPKGDYTLYIDLSDPANWVLIINKQIGQWGTIYDSHQDLGRVKF